MTAQPAGTSLTSLTSLRFVAALLVFLVHAGSCAASTTLRDALSAGDVGVNFFFILSGFVLTWSDSVRHGALRFYRHRVARIYPLHLLTWFGAGLVVLVGLNAINSPSGWAEALLLVQAWNPDFTAIYSGNTPSWTLSVEAFFYLVFPAVTLLVARTSTLARWLTLGAIALTVCVVFPSLANFYVIIAFPPARLLEFVGGVVLAALVKDGWEPPVSPRVALAIAGASVLAVPHVPKEAQFTAVTTIPFAMVIASCAAADAAGRGGWLHHPWLVRLGTWSFALYLVHYFVTRVGYAAFGQLDTLSFVAAALVMLAVSIGLAGVVHHFVEVPAERFLRDPSSARAGRRADRTCAPSRDGTPEADPDGQAHR